MCFSSTSLAPVYMLECILCMKKIVQQQCIQNQPLDTLRPYHTGDIYLFKVNNGNTRTMCEISYQQRHQNDVIDGSLVYLMLTIYCFFYWFYTLFCDSIVDFKQVNSRWVRYVHHKFNLTCFRSLVSYYTISKQKTSCFQIFLEGTKTG